MTQQQAKEVPRPAPEGSVGDVNSSAKGSGARFNNGKAPYDLVPLRELVHSLEYAGVSDGPEMQALACLALWQEGEDTRFLHHALLALGVGGWGECAHVFDYGRHKYAAWNWTKGMAWSIPLACAVRHLLAMLGEEVNDPESGLPHRGHIFCNICMLLTYTRTFQEGDDRTTLLSGARE